MSRMRALLCALSVRMCTCAPVNERAGTPRPVSAIANSAIEACSPVASSTSISRAGGCALTDLASLMRRSVSPDMADTTTTTSSPAALARCTRAATAAMRSGLPIDVPPYFCTIRAIACLAPTLT